MNYKLIFISLFRIVLINFKLFIVLNFVFLLMGHYINYRRTNILVILDFILKVHLKINIIQK